MAKKDEKNLFAAEPGRRPNQKLKPFLVYEILRLSTDDEGHTMDAIGLVAELDRLGISAERHGIYSDIEEINKAVWAFENGATIKEAAEVIKEDEEEKVIRYDKNLKGFYVTNREFSVHQIRLLAECVYSAKFLTTREADALCQVLTRFVSETQARSIRHDALLTDRVKTNNKNMVNSIGMITEAMATTLYGEPHTPQKISFKYLQYSINNVEQLERRRGQRYKVSPYALLINDGYYYLLAFDDAAQKLLTFRIDRMKDMRFEDEPRDGEEAFEAVNLKDFTRRTFSMFSGDTQLVTIQFINRLMDAVIDRFGTTGAKYQKVDDDHFTVQVQVDVSDQFFGWLLGFGRRAKLLDPLPVVEKFTAYLDKVREIY